MNCEFAFNTIDTMRKGNLNIEDFREFIKSCGLFPAEKDIQLLFNRFDKNEDGIVTFKEFVAAIIPSNN